MHKRIPALDGVRGVAVLWVMAYHFTYQVQGKNMVLDLGYRVLRHGDRGVDLFFILSGFLITGILLQAKTQATALSPYLKTFYWRRTMRIFPLYYLALVIFLLGVAWFSASTPEKGKLLSHQWMLWTYTSNIGLAFVDSRMFDAGAIRLLHLWSLAIEEQFYLCWPLVVWALSRRSLVAVCLLAAVVSPATWYVLSTQKWSAAPWYFTLCRVDGLCAGAAMAALLASVRERAIWRNLTAAVAVVGLLMLAAEVVLEADKYFTGYKTGPFLARSVLGYGAKAGMAAGLGVIAMGLAPAVDRLLSSRPLTFFGQYSYGLYVWHYAVVLPLAFRYLAPDKLPKGLTTPGALLVSCVVGIGLSTVLAMISYHGFEAFFLRLKERRPEASFVNKETVDPDAPAPQVA